MIRKLKDDFRGAFELGGVRWLNGWKNVELLAGGLVDEIEGPTGTKVIANHFRFTVPVRTEFCQQARTWSSRIWARDVDIHGGPQHWVGRRGQ